MYCFFFFKLKTSYEMRISDWSSDVCSSDLGDLRGRVIAAIEDGVSTREAARRFRIGISTAGAWHRRYRETGETEARKSSEERRVGNECVSTCSTRRLPDH